MSSHESVSFWIGRLKGGDQGAARKLWERYYAQLVELAAKKFRNAPRRVADEEDAVLGAFASFCRDAQRGRFPDLADRHDLWRLLVRMTAQKALDQLRRDQADKRGAGQDGAATDEALEQVVGHEPTPAFAAQVADEMRELLGRLEEADLRAVALWKLEGHSNEEIAAKLECVPRTVERKLQRIRALWSHVGEER